MFFGVVLSFLVVLGAFPKITLTLVGIGFALLIGWLSLVSRKSERKYNEIENHLAKMVCPRCSKVIGSETAHLARTGVFEKLVLESRLNEDLTVADCGWWLLYCPHCDTKISFDPDSLKCWADANWKKILQNKDVEEVKSLLALKIVEAHSEIYAGMLVRAIRQDPNSEFVKWMAKTSANLNQIAYSRITPLVAAVRLSQVELAKDLISLGADPNLPVSGGLTPLHYAVDSEMEWAISKPTSETIVQPSTEMTRMLLEAGAKADISGDAGFTPYDLALERGHRPAAKLLAQHLGITYHGPSEISSSDLTKKTATHQNLSPNFTQQDEWW